MFWKKKGLIFNVKNNSPWMISHASVPIIDKIKNNIHRIYFSTRDTTNSSHVGFIEVNLDNPKKILKISKKPILSPGKLGTFDDYGVMATTILNYKNKKFLYYVGWNRRENIPFHWSIGLAISSNNGATFEKYSEGPILDRTTIDPFFVTSPTVIIEKNIWKMWYASGIKWKLHLGIPKPFYNLKYAESKDGINWKRNGKIVINFKTKKEHAIGRANILKEKNKYKMWYSYGINNYRIGYAESKDGIKWNRKDDEVGIDISKSGWDSKSIQHSFVFKYKNELFMLYTGNDYGKTGFGLAVLEN